MARLTPPYPPPKATAIRCWVSILPWQNNFETRKRQNLRSTLSELMSSFSLPGSKSYSAGSQQYPLHFAALLALFDS